MEVIIAMGHFCDKHGPCVILCTHEFDKLPQEKPILKTPICSACESIELDTVFACEAEKKHYISSRTSLDINKALLLKDAVLRSLSIEMVLEDGKNSGTMYFGDNNRGHIIAHVFSITDSFARGFKRRYCIMVLGKHQVSLLSHYDFVKKNLRRISEDLQQKAERYNSTKRSSTTNVEKVLRSLPQLVGERNVFAQLHMWFVFLLRAKIFQIVPHNIPVCPVNCDLIEKLRHVKSEMPETIFNKVSFCIVTGIPLEEKDLDVLKYFKQLLPKGFTLPKGETCILSKTKDIWSINFKGDLPELPTLLVSIKEAIEDIKISNSALQHYVMSIVMHWFSVACVLSWAPNPSEKLMRTLEIRECDKSLLTYWIVQSSQCVELHKTDYFKPKTLIDK